MSIELKQAAQQAVDAFDAFGDADDFASLFELTRKMRALRTATQQAEVTDSMIREAFLANGFTIKDGHSDLKPYVYAAARAILALRPERVPMTGDQWTDVLGSAGPDLLDLAKQWADNKVHVYQVVNEAEKIVKAAVLRGITAQDKKEAP